MKLLNLSTTPAVKRTGTLSAHLAGLQATGDLNAAGETLTLTGLGLGDETSWVKFDSQTLFALLLGEFRHEDLHRPILVLMLTPLVLARGDNSRRKMSDAHRRVGHVDMLATGTGGTVRVDAQILFVDLDVGNVLKEWRHLERSKGGLTLTLRVERRHPHQTMNTMFRPQAPVSVPAINKERRRGNSCFVAG